MRSIAGAVCLVATSLFPAGCSTYSQVDDKSISDIVVTPEQRDLANRIKPLKGEPEQRIGLLLDAADEARLSLKKNPTDTLAQSDYNFAIARVLETIDDARMTPWEAPLTFPSARGTDWVVTLPAPDPRPEYHPSRFRMQPADRHSFRGKLVGERILKQGIGAPIVAAGRDLDLTVTDQFAQGNSVYYGFTAVAKFNGSRVLIAMYDPLDAETVEFEGHQFTLAADFQAPLALSLAELNLKREEISGMFNPRKFENSARLSRLQRYHPEKIPLLCIHGLGNSPATWFPVIDYLRGDEEIRKHYQIWFFSYPTGLPYPVTTAMLRHELEEFSQRHPDHKNMVVIGHSMGGMISRLLITDSGMDLWDELYELPPDELPVSEGTRQLLERTLIFEGRRDIDRVIYASASHRGSYDATNLLGRLGERMVGSSIAEDTINQEAIAAVREDVRAENSRAVKKNRLPNSIDILNPNSRFLRTVNTLESLPGVPYHSLIGDRGKGGNLDQTKPESSDGVVPYWSSHLDGAASEQIIPSGHWSHLHPAGMAEIKRILLLHVREKRGLN